MSSPRIEDAIRQSRLEIGQLLDLASTLPEKAASSERMSPQENQLRCVAVALVGLLQMYISDELEELADNLPAAWEALTDVQMRYVAVHSRRRIENILSSVAEPELADVANILALKKCVEECNEWHLQPSRLARSPARQALQGLLRDNGSKAIDKAISQLRPGAMRFVDWLHKNHQRYRGIFDSLDILIDTRNDVAHGVFRRRLTLREVRQYRVLVYRLVHKIDEYLHAQVGQDAQAQPGLALP